MAEFVIKMIGAAVTFGITYLFVGDITASLIGLVAYFTVMIAGSSRRA